MKCGGAHGYGGIRTAAPIGAAEPAQANHNRFDFIRQKPDKPKTNIMKRVGGQK